MNPLHSAVRLMAASQMRNGGRRRSLIGAGLDNTGSAGMNYSGAQFSRLTQDWIWAPIASADQEARWDIARLRARARELRRNNPYVARYAEMVKENVIGHDGIRLQARVANAAGDPDISINDRIEEAWAAWSEPDQASADASLSWLDHELLAAETAAIDGEGLVRLLRGYPNDFGFAVQALDIDLLDHTYSRTASARENEIRMGVEIDHWGKPVNYWLWTVHPYDINGSGGREREPVPAEDIIHLRRVGRPGQTRSVSWLAPVLLPLKMLGGFAEAELIAARTAASAMGFYIQNPEDVDDPDSAAGEGDLTFEAEAGTFNLLPPGVTDFKSFSPQHPNVQFDKFVKSVVRWIAGGLSVSYNALGNDLESVNYSSIRAGELAARDHWRVLHRWIETHLHRRVYREWLKFGTASGAIEIPTRNVDRWFAHRWMPRGWPWVDPLKDVTAAAAAMQLKISGRRRFLAQEGRDLEDTFRDIKEERELAETYGIELIDVIGTGRVTEPGTPAADLSGDENDDAEADENNTGSDDGKDVAKVPNEDDDVGRAFDDPDDAAIARLLSRILSRGLRRGASNGNGHHHPNGNGRHG